MSVSSFWNFSQCRDSLYLYSLHHTPRQSPTPPIDLEIQLVPHPPFRNTALLRTHSYSRRPSSSLLFFSCQRNRIVAPCIKYEISPFNFIHPRALCFPSPFSPSSTSTCASCLRRLSYFLCHDLHFFTFLRRPPAGHVHLNLPPLGHGRVARHLSLYVHLALPSSIIPFAHHSTSGFP